MEGKRRKIVMKTNDEHRYPTSLLYQYQLIESCKKGDQKAQLQIYKLFYRQVYNICLGLKKDPAPAEDLLHESFLLAFENISSYPGNISFTSWLIRYINCAAKND